MADGAAAQDPDRLPWLSDTARRRRSGGSTPLLFWAFLAIVLVAGVSYWLGLKTARQPDEFVDVVGQAPDVITDPLPELAADPIRPLPSPNQIQAPGLPDISLVPDDDLVPIPGVDRARPMEPEAKPVVTTEAVPAGVAQAAETVEKPVTAPSADASAAAAPALAKPVVTRPPPRLLAWPADLSAGAYGRVARVGTFYTRLQAKQGWARIVRVYPGIRKLRAVVVPVQSLRNGKIYYRLQFGTTSQAHSAVICQRMRVVGQSCVTVGLPGSGVAR
jgi:hypothetical protein